ncbi:MAG TPA: hypothetical protein VN718_04935 [Rhizomicrobium sp.]|nr:hypothetical protein [Rhizomicrobium sp.]
MKILAAVLFGGALMAARALAQDNSTGKEDMTRAAAHHVMRHKERYKRDYKSDQEERQATEDLNKQYRGVNAADVH